MKNTSPNAVWLYIVTLQVVMLVLRSSVLADVPLWVVFLPLIVWAVLLAVLLLVVGICEVVINASKT